MENEELIVFTDGGCQGNPGPGGWGCVILDQGKEFQYSGGKKQTTNNQMELTAAIEALRQICENPQWKNRPVKVFSDSQYVKNGITSWIKKWKLNGWKTAAKKDVLNKELWVQLDAYYSSLNVQWSWVKGHAGIKYNEMCDQLCGKEIGKFL
jgi:ribonuclease HI